MVSLLMSFTVVYGARHCVGASVALVAAEHPLGDGHRGHGLRPAGVEGQMGDGLDAYLRFPAGCRSLRVRDVDRSRRHAAEGARRACRRSGSTQMSMGGAAPYSSSV